MKVFLSYSHKDEGFKQELETHLSLLRRQNLIEVWHDRRIEPGDDWASQIDQNLLAADVVLILVSADFLASDYCYDVEMKKAFELHAAGQLKLVPIILRHCDWHTAPFGSIQGLPKNAKPVDAFSRRDEAYVQIAAAIRSFTGERGRSEVQAKFTGLDTSKVAKTPSVKRSSNLHVRRPPTDLDKQKFTTDAFRTITEFVRSSGQELSRRNDDVEVIEKIGSDQFVISVFFKGDLKSELSLWLSSDWGSQSIRYSTSKSHDKSWNGEFMLKEVDDQLGFTSLHAIAYAGKQQIITVDDCANEVWDQIMEPLQR